MSLAEFVSTCVQDCVDGYEPVPMPDDLAELPFCIRCGQRRRHAAVMHTDSECIDALKDALRKARTKTWRVSRNLA